MDRAKKEKMIKNFEITIRQMKESNVYLDYCKSRYGYPIRLYNALVKEDIQEIEEIIKTKKANSIVELGCGTGELMEYFATKIECQFCGVENSYNTIELLNTLRKAKNVQYIYGDMDDGIWNLQKYDIVLVIDSLYFVSDLETTIRNILTTLNREGIAIVFYSEYAFQSDNDNWKNHNTNKIGRILCENKIRYNFKDITEREKEQLKNIIKYGNQFKDQFINERNGDIAEGDIEEASFLLEQINKSGMKRFRYIFST